MVMVGWGNLCEFVVFCILFEMGVWNRFVWLLFVFGVFVVVVGEVVILIMFLELLGGLVFLVCCLRKYF